MAWNSSIFIFVIISSESILVMVKGVSTAELSLRINYVILHFKTDVQSTFAERDFNTPRLGGLGYARRLGTRTGMRS